MADEVEGRVVVAELSSAKAICQNATDLVGGDRAKSHGPKVKNHQNIADMWTAYLGLGDQLTSPITPLQAAMMMACLKIARTKLGDFNRDDYVDLAGYAGVGGEIAADETWKGNTK